MIVHFKRPVQSGAWPVRVKFGLTSGLLSLSFAATAQNLKISATLSATQADTERVATVQGASAPAVTEQQPLGPGDQITITVFGQPDMSAEVTVGENGSITVPLVGTIKVASLNAVQLQTLIANRLKEGGYLQDPGVSVQIRQIRSQMVAVLGEVQRPGRFPMQGRMTVLEAIATAGGLTERAERTVLLLRRPLGATHLLDERQEITISFDDPSGKRMGKLDATLQNEDVVFVSRYKQFFIHGEVRRSGAFPIEPGMNIMKALALSGGISERGSMGRITVFRRDRLDVLQEIKAVQSMVIQADDVIYVDERLF